MKIMSKREIRKTLAGDCTSKEVLHAMRLSPVMARQVTRMVNSHEAILQALKQEHAWRGCFIPETCLTCKVIAKAEGR